MMWILRILDLILKLRRRKKESSIFSEEEFIGYEAFTSEYQDKILKDNRNGIKFSGKS